MDWRIGRMIASRSEGKRKGLTYLCQSRAPRTPSWPTDMRDLPYDIIAILLCGTPGLISPILRLDNTFFFLVRMWCSLLAFARFVVRRVDRCIQSWSTWWNSQTIQAPLCFCSCSQNASHLFPRTSSYCNIDLCRTFFKPCNLYQHRFNRIKLRWCVYIVVIWQSISPFFWALPRAL